MVSYATAIGITDLREGFESLAKAGYGAAAAVRRLQTAIEEEREVFGGTLRGYSQSHLRKLLKQWIALSASGATHDSE